MFEGKREEAAPTLSDPPQDYGGSGWAMLRPFGVSDDGPGVARRRPAEPGEEKSLLVPGHLGEGALAPRNSGWRKEPQPPEIKVPCPDPLKCPSWLAALT